MTHNLAMSGFWSSFNRPYFPRMFIDMGYAEYEAKSNVFSFDNNPRVAIFRREQSKVRECRVYVVCVQLCVCWIVYCDDVIRLC